MGHPALIAFLLFAAGPLWAAGSPVQKNKNQLSAMFLGEGKDTQHNPESERAYNTLNPPAGSAPETKKKKAPAPDAVPDEPGLVQAKQAPEKIESEKKPAKAEEPADDAAAHQAGQKFYDGASERVGDVKKIPEKPSEQSSPHTAGADAHSEDIFVAVDLDLKANPDQYKDAVASLGRVASFRPDPRFAPAAPSPDRISFWGWMPANRVTEALGVAGVTRLHLDQSRPWAANLSLPDPALGRFLVSIRLVGRADGSQAPDKALEELAGLGFQPLRTFGMQTSPGGEPAFIAEGMLPVRALSLVLGHPQVLRVVPLEAERPVAAAPKGASPKGFFVYAADKAPLLLVLTLLLLLLPRLAGGWDKLCDIFIPYRR